MKQNHSKDHERSYEHLLPSIEGMTEAIGYKIFDETKKDLIFVLKIMGYVDYQYDKKDKQAQKKYYNQIIQKLENTENINMGEKEDDFSRVCSLLKKRNLEREFTFYIKKLFHHNDIACNTQDNNSFIKHKYVEGYISAKIITIFLTKEGLPYESEKVLCNLGAISNIFDDFLDIKEDYQKGISQISPSLQLKTALLTNTIWHTIDKFLASGKINGPMLKYVMQCTLNHLHKKFFPKSHEREDKIV